MLTTVTRPLRALGLMTALAFASLAAACLDYDTPCTATATCPPQTDAAVDSTAIDGPRSDASISDVASDVESDAGPRADSDGRDARNVNDADVRAANDASDVSVTDASVDGSVRDASLPPRDAIDAAAESSTPCVPGIACDVPGKPCRVGTILCATSGPVCAESDNRPNGSSCGAGTVCQEGTCKPCAKGEACTPAANVCHLGALDCSGAMPVCADTGMNAPAGGVCGQDKVCSSAGTCVACVAGASCPIADKPCRAGKTACQTGAPVCVESGNAPDGLACGPNQVCSNGACGACTTGAPCVPVNPCHAGTMGCSTGTPTCNDTGIALTNGTACGNNMVCNGGSCVACTSGTACQPTDICKVGTTSCATGTSVCVADSNKPAGTSCGPGQSCSSGRTTAATTCDANGQCATPPVTTCTSGFCNPAGNDCLVCQGGETACAGTCCAAGQGCCNNACTPLNTTSNCGVCGNACVAGKVCSGTQCLWEDGHVCAGGADCASSVCGGRCCPAGTSCKCTQPNSQNLVRNAGFDRDLSSWNIDAGPGQFMWQPRGPIDQDGYSGDAEQCPYSGSLEISCNKDGVNCGVDIDPADSCQPIWQCLPLADGTVYNFGAMMGNEGAGATHCALEIYTEAGCSGASTGIVDWGWVNVGWGRLIDTQFASGANKSAKVYCYRCGNGGGRVDMLFLTPNPGGY